MAVHVIMLGEFDLILGTSITNNGDDEGATCVRYQLRPEALDQGYTGTLLRRSLRDVQQDEEEMRLELYVNNSDQRYLFKGYAQPPPNKLNDYFLIFDPATNKFTLERLKHNYVLQTPCRNEPFITTAPPPSSSSKIAPSSLPISTPPLPASSPPPPPPPPPPTSSSPSPVVVEIKQDYSSFVSEGEGEEERVEVNDEATKLEPDIDAVLEAAWDSSSPAPSPSVPSPSAPEFESEVVPKLDLEPEDFSSSPSSSSSSSSPYSMVEKSVPKSSKTPAVPTTPAAAAIQAVSTPAVATVAMITPPAAAPQKKPIKSPTSPLKQKSEKDGKSLLSLRQRLGILQKPDMYEDEGSSATTASSTSSSSEESSSDEEEEEEEE